MLSFILNWFKSCPPFWSHQWKYSGEEWEQRKCANCGVEESIVEAANVNGMSEQSPHEWKRIEQ